MIDLTVHAKPRLINSVTPVRDLAKVDSIMLHQTCCFYKPGSDAGWKRLNAHMGFPRAGDWYLTNPLTMNIWHGNGPSPRSVGWEIEGNFLGLVGRPKTGFPKAGPQTELTASQKANLVVALDYCAAVLPAKQIKILAHRQSSGMRTWDPGEEIYKFVKSVADPSRFVFDFDYVSGTGAPIPGEWR